jgi:signal transduction histidine kinase
VGRIVEQRTRELERANAELLHSQKMRALGTLAAGVAHDFNGLLSIIKGSAQLLERAVPATDERARQRLARIQGAVEQGTGLVRAMLGYGRAGPRTGEAFDLPPALAEARGLLAESFGPRVRWEVPDALPAVFGSAEMLRQMLLNLVQNADEAMDARGETLVRVRRLEAVPAGGVLAPAAAGPCLALEVTDHGVGIPPEHLSRLFEPFFTTKGFSARRGTGLGLLMVHEFAKELGYGLQVESTVGAGSTFRILLPLAAPARPAGPG